MLLGISPELIILLYFLLGGEGGKQSRSDHVPLSAHPSTAGRRRLLWRRAEAALQKLLASRCCRRCRSRPRRDDATTRRRGEGATGRLGAACGERLAGSAASASAERKRCNRARAKRRFESSVPFAKVPLQGSLHTPEHCLVNGGFPLVLLEEATCFKWSQNVSCKEPCASAAFFVLGVTSAGLPRLGSCPPPGRAPGEGSKTVCKNMQGIGSGKRAQSSSLACCRGAKAAFTANLAEGTS